MSPSSFSTVSLINTASRKLCDSNSIPYTRGSPITTRYYFILVLMRILGSRVSLVELVPIFSLSGPSKLRSEGRGGPILLVSEGINFQFSPLWGSPATRGSSLASCHAYSLCGSGSCLYKVSGRPSALFFLLHDSVQSTHLTVPSPGSLNKAHLPQMRPPLTPSPDSFQPVTWPQHVHLPSRLSSGLRSFMCFLQLVAETAT